MCLVKTPKMPATSDVPQRQAARTPDNGDPTARVADRGRRRIAMAQSIYTSPTLGAPSVSGKLGA